MKVLVIDDSPTIVLAMRFGLERLGLEVVTATHLTEIVASTTLADEFDAVLLDVNMPVIDGATLHDKLVEWGWKAGIIFFSGENVEKLKALTAEKGGCYLEKTDDYELVFERIKHCSTRCLGKNCTWMDCKN